MGAEPPAGAESAAVATGVAVDARHELGDAPPFLGWNRIYLIVIGALLVEIVACWIITSAFQ